MKNENNNNDKQNAFEFKQQTVDDFRDLIKSQKDEQKIRSVLEHFEYVKCTNDCVPSVLTTRAMRRLILMSTKQAQKYYFLLYLYERRNLKHSLKRKRREERRITSSPLSYDPNIIGIHFEENMGPPIYGVSKNSLFCDANYTTRKQHLKLMHASLFGLPLVFDFSFEQAMSSFELNTCLYQFCRAVKFNGQHALPFNIFMCNYRPNSATDEMLKTVNEKLFDSHHFLNVTEKSYLELFPKNKLVYLSPDSSRVLNEFDRESIYIVGSCVNTTDNKRKDSLAKAKKEKLITARFPVERFALFKGNRDLSLGEVMKILLALKDGNDQWENIFLKSLFKSHLRTEEEILEKNELSKKHLKQREKFHSNFLANKV